jgi:WD40 repeat protein
MPAKEITRNIRAGFSGLYFAPDGKTLLTGGMDGVLRIWDTETWREIKQFSGFAGSPNPMAFAPGRDRLAVVDGNATIRLIRLADGKDHVISRGHRSGVSSIVVTPDCQSIVTSGYDDTLRFWDRATGRELRQHSVTAPLSSYPQLRPDGRTYLAAGNDRTYRLHDLTTGNELAVLRGQEAYLPFALSPDRKALAAVNADNEVRLLDPATGTVRHTLTKTTNKYTLSLSFTADSRALVVRDEDHLVTVWDVASGKKRRQFSIAGLHDQSPNARGMSYTTVLSADGGLLAVGLQFIRPGQNGFLPVLETTSGREICRFITTNSGARTLTFSPDGKSLAWAGWRDGTVYLGEIATGGERSNFAGHRGEVIALAFSPNGKMLISGSQDTTALVWDLTGRIASSGKNDKPLSADDLKRLWDTLAAEDAEAGFHAIQVLAADPERSVPYLRSRMAPVPVVEEERLKRLIADLESDQFAVRDNASKELEKLGESALQALRKAIEDQPSLETRRRLDSLLEKQEGEEWKPSAERRRIRRALEVLERIGTAEVRSVLTTVASGAPGAWLTLDAKAALERLAQPAEAKR